MMRRPQTGLGTLLLAAVLVGWVIAPESMFAQSGPADRTGAVAFHPLSSPVRPIWPSPLFRRLQALAELGHPFHGQGSRVHANDDAQSLQIPWSSFPPDAQGEQGSAFTPAAADDPNQNVFAPGNFHQQSYRRNGMQTGYFQQAQLDLSPTHDTRGFTLDLYWLGSIFSTSNQAQTMVKDAVDLTRSVGLDGQSCFIADSANCHLYIFFPNIYVVWSSGNAMGELLIYSNPNSFYSSPAESVLNAHTIGHDLQRLLSGGDTVTVTASGGTPAPIDSSALPGPPQPTIRIETIVLYRDVRGRFVPTTVVHLNELIDFAAAFHLSNFGVYLPSGDLQFFSPTGRVQLIQNRTPTPSNPDKTKVIFDAEASIGQAPSGTLLLESFGSFQSASALGKLLLKFDVNLASATDSLSTTFTLKETPAPCKSGFKAKHGKCVKSKR